MKFRRMAVAFILAQPLSVFPPRAKGISQPQLRRGTLSVVSMKNLRHPAEPTGKLRAVFALGCGLSLGGCGPRGGPSPTAQELPQAPTPNPAVLRAPGGFAVAAATSGPMPLSLDEAIDRGMRLNLQQLLAQQNERAVHGELLTVENNLLPTLSAQLATGTQEINLAAMGFKPSTVAALGPALGLSNFTFNEIVKVSTTSAQVNVSQQLFNLPAYEFYRAAQKAAVVAQLTTKSGRNDMALRVGTAYLAGTRRRRPDHQRRSARKGRRGRPPPGHSSPMTPASERTSTSSAPRSSSRPSSRSASAPRTPSPRTRSRSTA